MSKGLHSNSKKVIVKTENDEVWKEFESVIECADFFNKSKAVIYNRCNTPNHAFAEMGYKLKFQTEKRENVKSRVEVYAERDKEAKLRAKETEDETRRRLGLNPYGEWRNDEWIQAMIDRVDKMLYPDGYDPHMVWLREKALSRAQKGQQRESEEDRLSKEIDEEFEQYTK